MIYAKGNNYTVTGSPEEVLDEFTHICYILREINGLDVVKFAKHCDMFEPYIVRGQVVRYDDVTSN